jgi:hypothetical protein
MCYIFYKGGVEICVLIVKNNEHNSEHGMRDDNVVLSDVARGDSMGKTGEVPWVL